jgi:secreted PhoX family phosphatase
VTTLSRRQFLGGGLAAGALALGAGWRHRVPTAPARAALGPGPYGPLSPTPDANGLHLPSGFTSRVVGVSGTPVPGSGYVWHTFPDGGATFPTSDRGWIYVSNAEVPAPAGGVGALRFSSDGRVVDAYRILEGTGTNCAGGPTPCGTWLSCEEHVDGRVWECDPRRPGQGVERPQMGTFTHEAAAVDPTGKAVYLTEDEEDGRLYRFVPDDYPDLSAGRLQAAVVAPDGGVRWKDVPATAPDRSPETTAFRRGEGMWHDRGVVAFTTTGDNRVWAYRTKRRRLDVVYDGNDSPEAPLTDVDNLTMHRLSRDVFVAEDSGNLELCVMTGPWDDLAVTPFARVAGPAESEIAGPAFSPSGDRLYFSSQRGTLGNAFGAGITFEVTGPFRARRARFR